MFNGLSQSTLKVRSRGEKMHAELEVCLSTYRHTAGQKILKSPGKKPWQKTREVKNFFFVKLHFLAVLNIFPVQK